MDTERPQDETKVGKILAVGAVGILLTVATVIALTALFNSATEGELARKAASGPAEELRQTIEEQEEKLASYGYADREKGLVRIPIERAMELLVLEAQSKGGGK
ncbi:MAG: hypothetical protein MUE73_01610 [Planctomycetes bacterium]|jgi:hypothetical protein|nr:hypothetical protein [Planctomycetota bacterium]